MFVSFCLFFVARRPIFGLLFRGRPGRNLSVDIVKARLFVAARFLLIQTARGLPLVQVIFGQQDKIKARRRTSEGILFSFG